MCLDILFWQKLVKNFDAFVHFFGMSSIKSILFLFETIMVNELYTSSFTIKMFSLTLPINYEKGEN